MSQPIYATIQGNIGAGKSTIVDKLHEVYGESKKICFLQEPVKIWETITDENGTAMIELYYSNQEKYAFSFQMMAYISRLTNLRQAVSEGYDVIVAERSLETDKNVFAKMLYDDKKISEVEHKIYTKWFDEFKKDFPEEHVIYLRTMPEVALARVNKRARQGETIPLEYLQNCHNYHEDWLINKNPPPKTLILDANFDNSEHPYLVETWISQITEFLGIQP